MHSISRRNYYEGMKNASGDFNIKHIKGSLMLIKDEYVLTSEVGIMVLKIALDYFLNQMKSDSIGTNYKIFNI